MTPDLTIFELIKSLSKAEKSYLRKHCFSKGVKGKNYIKLFNEIEKQSAAGKNYDETKLKNKLKDEIFLKHFAVTKNYLYDLILGSLSRYDELFESDYEIKKQIDNSKALIKRGFYKQSKKYLRKAKELAYKNDKYIRLIEISRQEKNLSDISSIKEVEVMEREIYKDSVYAADSIKNSTEFSYLFNQLHVYLLKNPYIRNSENEKFFDSFFKNPLLKDESYAVTFTSRLFYYRIYMNYYNALNDTTNEFLYAKRLIDYLHNNKEKVSAYTLSFYRMYRRFLLSCLRAKEYKSFINHSAQMRELHKDLGLKLTAEISNEILESYGLEMNFYNNTGEFNKAVLLIKNFEEILIKNEKTINIITRQNFYYNIAVSFFGTEDYEKALLWINKLINNPEFQLNKERYFYSQILALIIHFELKNYLLLESLIRSIYRTLYAKQTPYMFEKLLMGFFKKLHVLRDETGLNEEFHLLLIEFKKLLNNPYEKTALEKFEFIEYLESKISGKPYAEIYRAKVNMK